MGWLPEAKALDLCDVPRATWASWERHGFVARPENGAYGLADVIRIALVAQLRKHLQVDDVAAAMRGLEREGDFGKLVELAQNINEGDRLDLIIEPNTAKVKVACDDWTLVQAVRHPTAPRAVIVVSPADELYRIVAGFKNRSLLVAPPSIRRRGRRRMGAEVVPMRLAGT
jgi:hypothetical protein